MASLPNIRRSRSRGSSPAMLAPDRDRPDVQRLEAHGLTWLNIDEPTEAETAWPLVGLLTGVLIAVGIAWGMYAGAVRINVAKFFKYTGVFLIVVAAGILAYGVGALQTVGWLASPGGRAFDISSWFNWSSWYGQIIRGVFNITPTPTVLQLACWLAYLVVVLSLFLKPVAVKAAGPAAVPVPERSAS